MKLPFLICSAICFATLLAAGQAQAGLGDGNPTGISGQFNGDVTTAGSYDPYTGNATRSVTDLVVAGTVGEYPLAFTRTMNTRATDYPAPGAGRSEFGAPGNWRHNYQWTIDQSILDDPQGTEDEVPPVYTVHYPDGRRVGFSAHPGSGDPYFRGNTTGITERFLPLDPGGPAVSCSCPMGAASGSKPSSYRMS